MIAEYVYSYSFPLPNHSLRSGNLAKTVSLGGCSSFCRMRVCFFSTGVGEKRQRVLAAAFVDLLRRSLFMSVNSNRFNCGPIVKIVEPFVPSGSLELKCSI